MPKAITRQAGAGNVDEHHELQQRPERLVQVGYGARRAAAQ